MKLSYPPAEKAPTHTQNIVPWIWYFLSPFKFGIIFFYLFRVFRCTTQALPPIVIGYVIDGLETGIAQENPQHFWTVLGVFGGLYLISLFNVIHIPESAMYEKAVRGMTLYGIRHLNRLSLNWHEKEGSGGKLQRVMTGRRGFQELMRYIRWDFMPLIGHIIAIVLSYMFMDLPLIFLPFYIAFIVTYLLSTWYFARKYFRLFDKFNEKFEKLLSGGQRQRLGIARALVRGAPIIIFDEATSSLDSISESKIQTAIENSFEDRTVFVIAHRLSTIRNVDHIIVLSEGTIIEQGDFDTLIQDNGHFAKLWKIQSKVQKGAEM